MKHIVTLVLAMACATLAMAQKKDIDIKTVYLDNGLKVVLAEDHTSPKIFGSVYVHAGSKNEDLDATGVAHYFEHIMFKGTDSIGTLNWAAESLYLDSISDMYDKLHASQDTEARKDIQREINRLSIAASRYAIPNEVDMILAKMGGTGLNAGTSYDMTEYHNTFPSNQLANWMDVYAERFRNPIFRLFQSELETVYEEKNMYADGAMNAFAEEMLKTAFGNHPYGRPVIGFTDHLKNPQPSRMRQFYNTFYVANNMTLILVGDFNTDEAIALARQKFSKLKGGVLPQTRKVDLPAFESNQVKEVKLTPVKLGALIFPGCKVSDKDAAALDIVSQLLSNGSSGLLDKLTVEHQLLGAYHMNLSLEDAGTNVIIYVPKLLGQKHEEAEQLVLACVDSLIQGRFSDELLEAAKAQLVRGREEMLEDMGSIANIITTLESTGKTYKEWTRELDALQQLTREDVMALAVKYFGGHHTSLRSSMGFPDKDRIEKPDWKPIEAQNTNEKSVFAQRIEANNVASVKPQVVDFDRDIRVADINNSFPLYWVQNPANDIFNLDITYYYGSLKDADLNRAVQYFDLQGGGDMDFAHFNLEMQKLGARHYVSTGEDFSVIHISGFEKDIDAILHLVSQHILKPTNDESQRAIIVDGEETSKKEFLTDAASWADAVNDYATYGDQSSYLRHTPLKQWKKRSGRQLLDEVSEIFKYNGYATYTGKLAPEVVARKIADAQLVKADAAKGDRKVRQPKQYAEPQVFVAGDKKFNQSNIHFDIYSKDLSERDKGLSQMFNKYFGHDMYSVVFQEIREFRSLGYSAYATFGQDYLRRTPSDLYAFVGTQSDKTLDALQAMMALINDLPDREDKFVTAKNALVLARNSSYVDFRSLPGTVYQWREMGYTSDPRMAVTKVIENADYRVVRQFYDEYIKGRPVVITMSGNTKRFNPKDLSQYGTLHILKIKDIVRF